MSRIEVPEELRRLSEAATPGRARGILPGNSSWDGRYKYRCFVLGPNNNFATSLMRTEDVRFMTAAVNWVRSLIKEGSE